MMKNTVFLFVVTLLTMRFPVTVTPVHSNLSSYLHDMLCAYTLHSDS